MMQMLGGQQLRRELRCRGILSDTGEDLETPKRRTWCVCEVCKRTGEIGRRRREEMGGRGSGAIGNQTIMHDQ